MHFVIFLLTFLIYSLSSFFMFILSSMRALISPSVSSVFSFVFCDLSVSSSLFFAISDCASPVPRVHSVLIFSFLSCAAAVAAGPFAVAAIASHSACSAAAAISSSIGFCAATAASALSEMMLRLSILLDVFAAAVFASLSSVFCGCCSVIV